MNIIGIIAEYNPFHKGHQYHIATAKETIRADYTIAIMSGPFVQRGSCAIADKYTRALAALECGADLVLELPCVFATSSAELFAHGAVSILQRTGIVTHLAFGSETEEFAKIEELAQIIHTEPKEYKCTLKEQLAKGLSFPKAREYALLTNYPQLCKEIPLNQPNTILALEYCKALLEFNSCIKPVFIKRHGGNYHQTEQDTLYSSATSIRKQLEDTPIDWDNLRKQLPQPTYDGLQSAYNNSFPLFDQDMSAMMRYALFNVKNFDYTIYADISLDLSNRIRSKIYEYQSFHQFATLLKTKEMTYSRICRGLIHILLGIKKEHLQAAKDSSYAPYFRVLAMKQSAGELLGLIKKHGNLPIITNPADYLSRPVTEFSTCESLTTDGLKLLKLDCHATHLRNCIAGEKFHQGTSCEYTRRFLKI